MFPGSKIVERNLAVGKTLFVVSDLHLHDENSSGYFSFDSCCEALEKLIVLVERKTPDKIWILGDLFHLSVRRMSYALAQLEYLQSAIETHLVVMAGNHDAKILRQSSKQFSSECLPML